MLRSIENTALCFGLYQGDPAQDAAPQIGFARVITDCATFAYLADVFVLPEFRGRGLSKWLMQTILAHPERWMEIARGFSVYDPEEKMP